MLFICHFGACRSKIGAAALNELTGRKLGFSAGTETDPDPEAREVPYVTEWAIGNLGLELDDPRVRRLSRPRVMRAGRLVLMTEHNVPGYVWARNPLDWTDIRDPRGGSAEDIMVTAKIIYDRVGNELV